MVPVNLGDGVGGLCVVSCNTKIRQLGLETGGEGVGKCKYELLGVPVGLKCLAAVLGIGVNRLRRARSGNLDHRYAKMGGGVRQSPKTDSVDRFLFELHSMIAETMPAGFSRCKLSFSFDSLVCVGKFEEGRCFRHIWCPQGSFGQIGDVRENASREIWW